MLAEEVYGALRSYIAATLVGMGAQKGAPCTITSIVDGTDDHTITFGWKDNDGVDHTSTLIVKDGATGETGPTGATGAAGFSPTIVVKTNTARAYVLMITDANGSYETPNLKGGAAGATELSQLEDIVIASLADKDVLIYDSETSKWKNTALGAAAYSNDFEDLDNKPDLGTAAAGNSTSSVTEGSEDLLTSGGAFTALGQKANKGTSLADYGITNAYTKTETDSAISTEIGKLDVSDSATAGAYVTAVSETNGKISVTRETADTTPTANSKKMLTSGGAKAALDEKQNTLTFDNAPTENSNNPVKSGGVYSADANIYAEMTRQGVKNILSQQFDEVMITASLGNKATSANGLTLTYNSDGSIKINGIPTDSSKNVAIRFDWDTNNHPIDISYLAGKKIVASISKTEINGIKIIPGYFDASDGAHQYSGADITTKGEYTYSNDAKWGRCYMSISGAYSYSNVTVYPMIYIPFEGATDDYAPPTKTNQELTEEQGYFTDDQWAAVTALLT